MNVPCDISHVWNKAHGEIHVSIILSSDFHHQEILSGPVRVDSLLHCQIYGLEPSVEHSLAHVQRVRGSSFDAIDFEIDGSRGRDPRSMSVLIQIYRVNGVLLRVRSAIIDPRHIHAIAVDNCSEIAIRYRWHEVTMLAIAYGCSAVLIGEFICDETSRRAFGRGRPDN